MLMAIVMLLFGFAALFMEEFKITNKRKVTGSISKTLGIILLVGAAGSFVSGYGAIIQTVTLGIVIIIGLVTSEKIVAPVYINNSTDTGNTQNPETAMSDEKLLKMKKAEFEAQKRVEKYGGNIIACPKCGVKNDVSQWKHCVRCGAEF